MRSEPGRFFASSSGISAALLLIALTTGAQSAGAQSHPLFRDAIDQYPRPTPVERIPISPNLEPDPRVAEVFARPASARAAANEAVSLRVTGMAFRDEYPGLATGEDRRFLVLDTEWRNLQPPQEVARSSAEGKTDRSMGAGGLTAGGSGGASATVLADVAYKVPKLGDHVFLLADGLALDLAGGSLAPDQPLGIGRQNETRSVQLVFAVSADVRDIALHFFDYRQGHIRIELSGNPGPLVPPRLHSVAEVIELHAEPAAAAPNRHGLDAPNGWIFQPVHLIGRSLARSGKVSSILELQPGSSFWLEVDGGRLVAPTPAPDLNPQVLRFTPELFQRRELVFLVPVGTTGLRLGLRAGGQVLRFGLSDDPPAPAPPVLVEQRDGTAMVVRLYGLRRAPDAFMLDLGIEPLIEGKGVEIATARQFALIAGGQRFQPDPAVTAGLAFGAGEILVAPPRTPIRFELAFAAQTAATALSVSGFRGEYEINLAGLPIDQDTGEVAADTMLVGRLSGPAVEISSEGIADEDMTATAAPRPERERRPGRAAESPPPPPPVFLPPAQTDGLPGESEPYDSFAEATLIEEGLAISGFLKQGDRDFITFILDDQPQLWAIEASGAGIREVAYHENSGQYTLRRPAASGSDEPVSMTHLHLLPGRHTVSLVGKGGAEAQYALRMVPLGPSDPTLEHEPNDLGEQANLVPIGAIRHGWLFDRGDKDNYRFSLQAESRLRLTVTPPAASRITAQVGRVARFESPEPGQAAVHEGVFAPGDHTLELKARSGEYAAEAYSLHIERLNPFGDDTTDAIALSFPQPPPTAAAFRQQAQRLAVPLRLENLTGESQRVALSTRSSHWAWSARVAEAEVNLAPHEVREVDIAVGIMPDAWSGYPVQVAVRAQDSNGHQAIADMELSAACDAPPLGPRRDYSIPEKLRGGFNLAWSAFGSEPVGEDGWRQVDLYDGLTPNDKAWSIGAGTGDFPYELTVKLAGEGRTPVVGVLLNPQGSCQPDQMVNEFEVLLSADGVDFSSAVSGQLQAIPREQAWLLDTPVTASHARLRILSNHGGNRGRLCLGEFKVVSDPAVDPWAETGLNIGSPAVGGHIVWSRPLISQNHTVGLLSEESESPLWKMDHLNTNEFVVGLHHNRAALVSELQWVRVEDDAREHLTWVQVSASMNSPVGPWKSLGRWKLQTEADQTSVFRLQSSTWVRFLRFSNSEPEKPGTRYLPETLRIIEAETGNDYRSILGEWGHYAGAASHELRDEIAIDGHPAHQTGQANPHEAESMQPGEVYRGMVSRGGVADWYRISLPNADNTVELTLHEGVAERLQVDLQDDAQQSVHVARHVRESGETVFSAAVEGGKDYRLKVSEPERSIVIAWDNSGSVSPYKTLLYQSLAEFARDVAPGVEYVNFVPFQDPPASLLTDQWLDQPFALQTVLNDYDRRDSSSNAETNLLRASEELSQREGSRAILVLTDAASTGYRDNSRMWAALQEVRPRIFSLELHSGNPKTVPRQQDLMQDLAMVNGGHYSYFSSQADLDLGFRRASCMLRRPVGYALSLASRAIKPPEPGAIEVELNGASPAGAIEIIFDASGSMWARLDGTPRIQIAREVLVGLVNDTLPDGTIVALRVFGNREAQSCRTDLEIEPGPLDRDALITLIEGIRPQDRSRTPLAESLRRVEQDLASIDGTKLLILLTDGEESCEGDPDAAIAALREQGMDIRLNIVGLAIEDDDLKNNFSRWAESGGGMYFEAASRDQLGAALREAMLPKFQVLDAVDSVVAEGTAGAVATEVPVGRYRVRVLTTPPMEFSDVVVTEGNVTRISGQPD